jgi:hypothetical protein
MNQNSKTSRNKWYFLGKKIKIVQHVSKNLYIYLLKKYMKYSQRVVVVLASYMQNGQWLEVNLYIKTI